MDHVFTRGAVAAFTFGALVTAAPAARAQAGGAGVIVRAAQRDTMVLLRIFGGPGDKAKIESLTVFLRMLESEPAMSPNAIRLRGEVDTLVKSLTGAHARVPGFFRGPEPRGAWEGQRLKGWIGMNVGLAPREVVIDGTGHYERYLAYPQIVSVEQDSPASRAGLARGDILIAYDGQDVARGRVNLSELLVPDRKIAVTVRRDGEVKDFSVVVGKPPEVIAERRYIELRPAMPGGDRASNEARGSATREVIGRSRVVTPPPPPGARVPGVPLGGVFIARTGVFGAALITIDSAFARVMNLEEGVRVKECAEGTMAYRAGLRVGDMITSVEGIAVSTASEVQAVVMSRAGERAVTFHLLREKKPVTVNVKW